MIDIAPSLSVYNIHGPLPGKRKREEDEEEKEKRAAHVKSRDPHQTWWGKSKDAKKYPSILIFPLKQGLLKSL